MAITSFNIRFQRMAFHFEEQIQILFSSLKLTDKNQLVTACVIFALLAFFNESLKLARAKIQIKMKPKQFLNVTCTQKIFNGWHFFQTILHCLQVRKNNLSLKKKNNVNNDFDGENLDGAIVRSNACVHDVPGLALSLHYCRIDREFNNISHSNHHEI